MSLPLDMIGDILIRLPVKSLLRFRSTSKPICSMIDAPYFTNTHLRHSNPSLVLTSFKLYTIDLPKMERAVEIDDHPLIPLQSHTDVLGSCNGLLCLCNPRTETLLLWNKSTRTHHKLPRLPIDPPYFRFVAHGFGFDPVHDDYKVMRVVRFGREGSKVSIFSLKSNSWKRVGRVPCEIPLSKAVFGDGALYWYTADLSIVAFDLATEEYRAVPMPPVAASNFVQMIGWEGRLCVVANYEGKPTQMWVWKGNEGWEKLQPVSDPRVAASTGNVLPVARVGDGNELVLLQEYVRLLGYDLKTNKARDVVVRGLPPRFDQAVLYVESLVKPLPVDNGGSACATVGKHKGSGSKKAAARRDNFLSKGFKLVL